MSPRGPIAALLCLLAVGCAGSKVLYLDPHPLPPAARALERPVLLGRAREKLEAKLVTEAARLGGEAVILCAEKRDSPFVWTYVPLGMAGTANRTTLAAKVIVFASP